MEIIVLLRLGAFYVVDYQIMIWFHTRHFCIQNICLQILKTERFFANREKTFETTMLFLIILH